MNYAIDIIKECSSALIRAEVLAGDQRGQLERAIHDAINKLDHSVDEVSAASGLAPAEVRKIAARTPDLTGDALTGIAA